MEEVMTEMLMPHVKLEDKLIDLEGRSRRENVRIYGVPEGAEKESPTMVTFFENLLSEDLRLTKDKPDFQVVTLLLPLLRAPFTGQEEGFPLEPFTWDSWGTGQQTPT